MKKTFLESFACDPAQFIQTWLESQSRDLESILGSGPTEGQTVRHEELKRSEFFQLPWVEEVRVHSFTFCCIVSWTLPSVCIGCGNLRRRSSCCETCDVILCCSVTFIIIRRFWPSCNERWSLGCPINRLQDTAEFCHGVTLHISYQRRL
jgi:hypothetical protein